MARPRVVEHRQQGFTLIELVVVLAIIAAITAIAYTYFMPLAARVRVAYDRDDFERQLLELPQRARLEGHGGVLTGRSGDNLPAGTIVAVEGAAKTGDAMEQWRVLRLELPSGWRLQVAEPIFYHFSGACEGGRVAFVLPPTVLRYVLTAPLCRPIRDDTIPSG